MPTDSPSLPYAMAIVALVVVARRAAYPQALMKPYRKGERYIWLVDKSAQPWAEENGWRPDVISFWVLPVATP